MTTEARLVFGWGLASLTFELLRDPLKKLLNVRQPRLTRRRIRLDDIDLVVQRLDLRQLHRSPPFDLAARPNI